MAHTGAAEYCERRSATLILPGINDCANRMDAGFEVSGERSLRPSATTRPLNRFVVRLYGRYGA
jgi:hypothetical protein